MPALYQQQFDPGLDFPQSAKPRITYILCSTPRCGSHLLGHTLYKTGQLGWPLEYFNPVNLPIWQQRFNTQGIEDTLAAIQRHRTSTNGCFGCKLHYDHFELLVRDGSFDKIFPDAACILIRRKDLVSQAVSWSKAESTGAWISSQPILAEPKYSYQSIEKKLQKIVIDNARWLYAISRRGWPVLEISYEDFIDDPDAVIASIFKFLCIERDRAQVETSVGIPSRQKDDINVRWKREYLLETSRQSLNTEIEFASPSSGLGSLPTSVLIGRMAQRIKNKAKLF